MNISDIHIDSEWVPQSARRHKSTPRKKPTAKSKRRGDVFQEESTEKEPVVVPENSLILVSPVEERTWKAKFQELQPQIEKVNCRAVAKHALHYTDWNKKNQVATVGVKRSNKRAHSEEYLRRKKQKKNSRYRPGTVVVPHTPQQRDTVREAYQLLPTKTIYYNYRATNVTGDIAILYKRRPVPPLLNAIALLALRKFFNTKTVDLPTSLQTAVDQQLGLEASKITTNELYLQALLDKVTQNNHLLTTTTTNTPPYKPDKCVKRGQLAAGNFGVQRKYQQATYTTKGTDHPAVQHLIRECAPLFSFLEKLVQVEFPALGTFLRSFPSTSNGDHTTYAGFPNFGVVQGASLKEHLDPNDSRNGLCMIFAAGDFTEENLSFPELNLEVALRPGDVILFKSHLLKHNSCTFKGLERYVFVFYGDHRLYTK